MGAIMIRLLGLCGILTISGCATKDPVEWIMYGDNLQAKPFTAPDGRQAFALTCAKGIPDCHDRARKACDGNYELLDQSTKVTRTPYEPITRTGGDLKSTELMQVACAK